jgi:hypothetical protein
VAQQVQPPLPLPCFPVSRQQQQQPVQICLCPAGVAVVLPFLREFERCLAWAVVLIWGQSNLPKRAATGLAALILAVVRVGRLRLLTQLRGRVVLAVTVSS